jgi:leucyl-tRNA synthetase
LFNQGYVQAPAYTDARGIYVPAKEVEEVEPGQFVYRGEPVTREFGKIGKSLKNVVTPDEICDQYGADTFRLFLMSMGPLDISRPWEIRALSGSYRFLQRVWRNFVDEASGELIVDNQPPSLETTKLLHRTIRDVSAELDAFRPNTAIARLIELNNHLTSLAVKPRAVLEPLAQMLSPFAPLIAEELWQRLGRTEDLSHFPFPIPNPEFLVADFVTCIVQINGKLRATLSVDPDISEPALTELALSDPNIIRALAGQTPRRVIVKLPKVVSLVV